MLRVSFCQIAVEMLLMLATPMVRGRGIRAIGVLPLVCAVLAKQRADPVWRDHDGNSKDRELVASLEQGQRIPRLIPSSG